MPSSVSTFEHHLDQLDLNRLVDDGIVDRDGLVEVIRDLDQRVSEIDGVGFRPTPFTPQRDLATVVGLPASVELWVKDETGNVTGSHKGRHLFGVAVRELLVPSSDGPWAIASCGNAALAASAIAAAARRSLDVFVPTWADEHVVASMTGLGSRVTKVERSPGEVGDPAHAALLDAVTGGAVPFTVQGTEQPAAIDGGRTLAFEMVERLAEVDHGATRLDRLLIQVGGGALGTSVVTGLARSELSDLPMVHVVQPVGNHPLVVAWDTLVGELLDAPVGRTTAARRDAARTLGRLPAAQAREVARRLALEPGRYMRPWPSEPTSYATGILDDITYDWIPLVEAMVRTGGFPIVAPEHQLRAAHRVGRAYTGVPVCPTGAAGLGGLLTLVDEVDGEIGADERVAVLFTGHQRPGDPGRF